MKKRKPPVVARMIDSNLNFDEKPMRVRDNLLFADARLSEKFQAATEIMVIFVNSPSQIFTIELLARNSGRSTSEVAKICIRLKSVGLVQRVGRAPSAWKIARLPTLITLEDVYRSVVISREKNSSKMKSDNSLNLDLLLMQATSEVNRLMFQGLRQYSLGILRFGKIGNSSRI